MFQVIALRAWGRLNMSVRTGPSRVTTTSSVAGASVGWISVATAAPSLQSSASELRKKSIGLLRFSAESSETRSVRFSTEMT